MSELDLNPICLICVRKIENSSKKSSFGAVGGGGGHGKLFRRLLIFAERRLKLGGSITSVFLSSADYQRHHLEPPPIAMKNDNYFNSMNQNPTTTKAEIFCGECSEMVKNLCQLYDNICTIERLMLRKLEEFGEKLQEHEQQQPQSLPRKKLKSKSNDADLKLNPNLARQKLAQQIEELRLDKGQDQQDPDTEGLPLRRSRRSGAEGTRLRDLLVRQVREYLQEINDPVTDCPETVTSSSASDSVDRRRDPDLGPKSQATPSQPQPSFVNDENQNQPKPEDSALDDMDQDDDDNYDGHDHDDDHDDPDVDANDDMEDDEDEPEPPPTPPRKRRGNARGGSSEDEEWVPTTYFQKPRRNPLDSDCASPSPPPPPPKKSKLKLKSKKRHRRRGRPRGDDIDSEDPNNSESDGSPSTESSSRKKLKPMTDEQLKWKARPCGICGISFRNGRDLMAHMNRVHEKKMRAHLDSSGTLEAFSKLQCIFCPASYFLEESLQVHKEFWEKDHEHRFGTEFRFRCDGPCGEGCPIAVGISYVTLGDLSDHLERDHAGDTIFKCSKCPWSFLHKNSRDFHETLHAVGTRASSSGSGQMYQCPAAEGCHLTFPKLPMLQKHFSHSHADNLKPFECSNCPVSQSKKFFSMNDLRQHQKGVHERAALIASIDGDGDFVCELCSKRFKHSSKLSAHHLSCRKKNQCDVCEEKFDNLQELIDHLTLSHFPEGRYICSHKDCGKAYQLKTTFRAHVRRHDEASKTFLCPHCPKTYHRQNSYKNHLDTEHALETTGEERKRTKICDECGAAYFTNNDLREHRAAKHVTEETEVHQCPLCEKNFTVKNWMKTHIRRMHKKDWRDILGGARSGHLPVPVHETETGVCN